MSNDDLIYRRISGKKNRGQTILGYQPRNLDSKNSNVELQTKEKTIKTRLERPKSRIA